MIIHLKSIRAGRILRQSSVVNALRSPIVEAACPEALEGPSLKAWISVDWKRFLLLASLSMTSLAMQTELNGQLFELPLTARNKVATTSRRFSLLNLKRIMPKRTSSASKVDSISSKQGHENSPTSKRLSFSSYADLEAERALIVSPGRAKRVPVSGEESSDKFMMTLFNARNRVCSLCLEQKLAELAQAQLSGDQDLIQTLIPEIELLDKQVMQFAQEQNDWLEKCLLQEQDN